MDVVVVGAGVIGLTTAVVLAEHGYRVLVQTKQPPESTTSAAAGALWGPWLVEPRDKVHLWAAATLSTLTSLAATDGTGVELVSGVDASTIEHTLPEWFALLPDVRPCTADELPAGYSHGVRYSAPCIDMPVHLAYLVERFAASNGVIEMGTITSLTDPALGAPVVINCAGMGARELTGDQQLVPIRGQHLVVTNPGLTEFLEVDTGDSPDLIAIYPHGDHVVLGGTAEPDAWSLEPDHTTAAAILARCAAVEPLLNNVKVLEHRVGLRPTRPEIRVEEDLHSVVTRIIHNYGHGGAGVSLAWACAARVLALLHSP